MSFDLGKFAQNLQRVGTGMLGNGILLASTREINRGGGMWGVGMGGFYGPSIWGCTGGMMGCTPPPMNIFHPMYSSDVMCNPYLTQQGMDAAFQYGRNLMENIMSQQHQLVGSTGTDGAGDTGNIDSDDTSLMSGDVEANSEFSTKMANGEDYTFIDSSLKSALESGEITDESKELYKQSILKAGTGHLKYLDEENGDGDGKLTVNEFIESLVKERPNEDKSKLANAAALLDLDGDKIISPQEMSTLMSYMDDMGAGEKRDGTIGTSEYSFVIDTMQEPYYSQGFKEGLTEAKKNLFGE